MDAKRIIGILEKNVTKGQEWIVDNLQYLVLTGSRAYGIEHADSDWDVVGVTIPPKWYVYPEDMIQGFDEIPRFDQFQFCSRSDEKKECCDTTIYSIVKYFRLVMENNPNMIDTLFVPTKCILMCTDRFRNVVEQRHVFLHKGCYHKYKGYAFSQLGKIRTSPDDRTNTERKKSIGMYGYDTKFAVHLVRLMDYVEQVFTCGTIDMYRAKEHLKMVRKGFYTLPELEAWFKRREEGLHDLYLSSTLRHGPDVSAVRSILSGVLEDFGWKN